MVQTKRPAPNPEWVLMYRQGIPAPKIAAIASVAATVVRYHLAIAAKQAPGLREDHKEALPPPPPRVTDAGRRNLADILALYAAEGRLPVSGRSSQESTMAGWLTRCRKQAAEGILSPVYAEALAVIPGWRDYPTKRDTDAARWKQRLAEVAAYLAAGHDWPRHNKTDDQAERTLGVWLHTQRIDRRAGKLTAAKEKQLNDVIPGWQQGRWGRGTTSRKSGTWYPGPGSANDEIPWLQAQPYC
ncbi:helicase associated domain-containing protein [Arthrobacter sp. HMWF013]|uniref:helicase associated domain-containing protein n=1 Tax=Arthrobacter sp. HMWF013 TaxID=2056849 RepID=UPI000D33D5D0|nr:helicase associated domain-containing protein [Arthrobacter sp. HMWF013]PTT68493.1 helicase-associated protein [Arthrobacter sp. HMWF013]